MKGSILLIFLAAASSSFKLPDYSLEILDDDDRIIGGHEAIKHAYPFMARVTTLWGNNKGSLCGGTLLSDEWVLTAGHCVYKGQDNEYWYRVVVNLGDHDRYSLEDGEKQIEAETVIIHEDFINKGTNDVALIKLIWPAESSKTIKPACINGNSGNFVGQDAHVIGWGRVATDGSSSDVLKEAVVPIKDGSFCSAPFDSSTNICTGFKQQVGQDTVYKGDSGGPLFFNSNDGFNVIGVASYVEVDNSTPEKVTAAIFTKTSPHITWMEKYVGSSLCVKS